MYVFVWEAADVSPRHVTQGGRDELLVTQCQSGGAVWCCWWRSLCLCGPIRTGPSAHSSASANGYQAAKLRNAQIPAKRAFLVPSAPKSRS